MKFVIAALLALAAGSTLAETFSVSSNGTKTSRTTYAYIAPVAAKFGAANGTAKVGAACDCSTKLTSAGTTYCAVAGVKPIQLAVCAADPWTPLAKEGESFKLNASQVVRFGVNVSWSERVVAAGVTTTCASASFGMDPLVGFVKTCQLKAGDPVVLAAPPAVVDHSFSGPAFDAAKAKALVVDPANRYTSERITAVYNSPIGAPPWWIGCKSPTERPDCSASPGSIANPTFDIGAFREIMFFACMNTDDAIVFPGQPGKAHLHTYFGQCADASTTSATIGNATWTSSAGGLLNKTAAWVPAMIDTKDGTPVAPHHLNLYYKGSYEIPENFANIAPVPVGLRFISGDAKNADPKVGAVNVRYICNGPNGENPGWKGSITEAFADGTCRPGGNLTMGVNFPICWDGVNLDSPNHQSHMAGVEQLQTPPFTKSCPASHPIEIPTISFNVVYEVHDALEVGRWRLSSDAYDPALPAGLSGHGDYMMGWTPEKRPDLFGENNSVVEHWTKHCLRERRDCHDYLLGDNLNMFY